VTIPTLSQVQSFAYIIGSNAGELANQQAIGASSAQLIFAGTGPGELNLNRSIADPNNNKIILGYIDSSEANLSVYTQLAPGGVLPSWFGPLLFQNQYSVQYWNPAWETAIFGEIDKLAAAGYNGVFLDSISGYLQWPNSPNAEMVIEIQLKSNTSLDIFRSSLYKLSNAWSMNWYSNGASGMNCRHVAAMAFMVVGILPGNIFAKKTVCL